MPNLFRHPLSKQRAYLASGMLNLFQHDIEYYKKKFIPNKSPAIPPVNRPIKSLLPHQYR